MRTFDCTRGQSVIDAKFADQEFVQALEDLTFPIECFHHREHIRLAWLYLQNSEEESAATRMAESIHRLATCHNASGKFHATITYVWVRLVAAAIRRSSGLSFPWFLAANPELLDKRLPYNYYSPDLIDSPEAKTRLVQSDLAPLP